MELLNPAGVWWLAALPLLLVPYLMRERPARRVVAALFLYGDPSSSARPGLGSRVRLPPRFFLQLLLLFAILAALVRPAWVSETTRSALVLDNTASLAAVGPDGRSRLEALRASAEAAATAGGSALWDVWALAPTPHPVAEGATPGEIFDRIGEVAVEPCPDLPEERLGRFLSGLAARRYAQIHVVTDRPSRDAGVFRAHRVGEPLPNDAIVDVSIEPLPEGAAAHVSVASFRPEPARTTVSLEVEDGEPVAPVEIGLEPGATATARFEVASGRRVRAMLPPGDALRLDDRLESGRTVIGERSLLVVGSGAAGLDGIPGLRVEVVTPADYRPERVHGHDVVLFHRAAPETAPGVPAIYVVPPPRPGLPREVGTRDEPPLALADPTSPLVRYLRPAALRPASTVLFEPEGGWRPLLASEGGAAVLVRGREAVTGFDLLPWLGGRNRPVSILTLDLLTRLGGDERVDAGCTIAGSAESNLLEPPPMSLPEASSSPEREEHARPLWQALAVLAVVLLLVDSLLPGRAPLPARLLRVVVAALLLAAVADVKRSVPGEPLRPLLLVDQSASLLPETRGRLLEGIEDRAFPVERTIPFGTATATNLEKPLEEIALGPDAGRDAILVTDGWETEGNARRVLPTLARRGIRIDVRTARQSLAANVAVDSLSLPAVARSGDSVAAEIVLRNGNDAPVGGTLVLRRDGRVVRRERVGLVAGSNVVRMPVLVTGEGLVRFDATLEPDAGAGNHRPGDDSASAWLAVAGGRRVLVVSGRGVAERPLVEGLERRGVSVTARTGGPLPSLDGFDAVFLNDLPAREMTIGEARGLRDRVRGGGALVMIGGENGFGLGGWAGSPVEEALPVRSKPREREEPRTAVVLLVDKSGSMRQERRILYAREAARQLVRSLRPTDRLAVIGFDRLPFTIVPLRDVADVRTDFEDRIGHLQPHGGTRLYPALVEAQRALFGQEARRRHVIVLSDGLSEDAETAAGRRRYYDLALAFAQADVTISTIALGREADSDFLERVASFGRGAFHQTDDPSNLPELVLGGLDERGREQTFREGSFTPRPRADSRLVGELTRRSGRWPDVLGFVETLPRDAATTDVAGPDGLPLIASWRYGAGRAVAVTTDASGRWSARWVRWNEWSPLWSSVLDWLAPEPAEEEASFALGMRDGALRVAYVRFDEDPTGPFTVRWNGPAEAGGETVLERAAPGRFEAAIPVEAAGDYRIGISGPGGPITRPPLGFTVAAKERVEVPREEPDRELLERIAEVTGGRINPSGEELGRTVREAPREQSPLAPWLLPLAMLLFVADVTLRRRSSARA